MMGWLGLASMVLAASTAEANSLTFRRWEGQARLISNPGPGETYYRLLANVSWADSMPQDPGRYRLSIALPDGRTLQRELRRGDGPRSNLLGVYVPETAVRDRRPEEVEVRVSVIDVTTGAAVGAPLVATIEQFPAPRVLGAAEAAGPFGWGRPLTGSTDAAQPLPRPGPDGLEFVRIPSTDEAPGAFLSRTEATNRQVSQRLSDHDPNAGRSDEFLLDAPDQPAVNLTPQQALEYLSVLSEADPAGVTYRLPTEAEWKRAALAGQASRFWWGDDPEHPEGANFLGPEPRLPTDTTVNLSAPRQRFAPNPWGLLHTFGNVAEWVTTDDGGDGSAARFKRLGGHFRTDPAEALPEPEVDDPADLGPDPYVGLRPAFDLEADQGAERLRSILAFEPSLAGVTVSFDPDRATATLTGTVAEPGDRKRADELLRPVWFLSALENQIETPTVGAGRLLRLVEVAGPATRVAPLGRVHDEVPIRVRWANQLPVDGSNWYVNVFQEGGSSSHRLNSMPGADPIVRVLVPVGQIDARSVGPATVALSLGAPVTSLGDSRIVSDPLEIRWEVGELGPAS